MPKTFTAAAVEALLGLDNCDYLADLIDDWGIMSGRELLEALRSGDAPYSLQYGSVYGIATILAGLNEEDVEDVFRVLLTDGEGLAGFADPNDGD